MTRQTEAVEGRREGSRWIDAPPSGAELATWFKDNARLDEGLDPGHYVGGVQLIPQKETIKVARRKENGGIFFAELEQLAFTPYVRVDTRVRYFWDLCDLHGWLGEIRPANLPRVAGEGVYNENLGAGFFRYPVKRFNPTKGKDEVVHYIGCSMQVRVLTADGKRSVMCPPPATKVVPMLQRSGYEDPSAPLKAETGAVGRALGMAGMLVLPGAGIATAEDMHEILSGGAVSESETPAPEADARDRFAELASELEAKDPGAHADFQEWALSRGITAATVDDSQARVVVRKLEQALERVGKSA